jgi:hypothetical protein
MNWHTHVHTHYATYRDGVESVRFAEDEGWLPAVDSQTYSFDEIPRLAQDYEAGKVSAYFPIFEINPL